jgi:hypothetical protein
VRFDREKRAKKTTSKCVILMSRCLLCVGKKELTENAAI